MSARTLLLALFSLVLLVACLPQKYTLETLPPKQIRFGAGGGFTGLYKEYRILENGQVFLLELANFRQDTFELETLGRPASKRLFRQLDSLRLNRYDFNFPGNMSYYIRTTDELTDHTVQWGDPRRQVRQDVEACYLEWKSLLEDRKVISQIKYEPPKPKDPVFW